MKNYPDLSTGLTANHETESMNIIMPTPSEKMILPPANIAVLGGGQLGSMLCEAGRRMGYRMIVLSESTDDPAGRWATHHTIGDTRDPDLLRRFAQSVDVLTNEFEQVSPDVLAAAESVLTCRVAPSSLVQKTCRDRRLEKTLFATHNIPHGPFVIVESPDQLPTAYERLSTLNPQSSALSTKPLPVIAKTARGGYDGKGQLWLRSPSDAASAWQQLGAVPLMLEQAVPFIAEISVIIARSPSGALATFPMFRNEHRNGILHQTVIPSGFSAHTELKARAAAEAIATALNVVGLLTIEMFVLENGDVWMNELAARPHNSGHVTNRACTRSQFELHIAAICNLPLPPIAILRPAVMTNLLGDLWTNGQPHWSVLHADPRATLHLYGKTPRPGRKMGHMIHTADTPDAALARANAVFDQLPPPRA